MTPVAFQSILQKQIRKLPKILKSVRAIQYYSFVSLVVTRVNAVLAEIEAVDLVMARGPHLEPWN